MGKKVKKKARSGQKDKRGKVASSSHSSASPKSVLQERLMNNETPNEGLVVVKNKRVCPHIDKGIDLEKVSEKLKSSEPLRCEDCREDVVDKRAGKGKNKPGKKKGGTEPKSESKAIWVCLDCGHFSCGGVGFPTTPQSHAVRHAKQHRHPLAVQFENSQLRWCFLCSTIISVENVEDGGETKDALRDVVKLIKGRSKTPSIDVEDIWFGSGSVTSGIKSETCSSIDSEASSGYMVRGLMNLGNTCFFNSVMQNLLAMGKLRDYFNKLEGSLGPLTSSFKKLFMETNLEAGLRGVINPRSFLGCVCAKAPQFRGYQQHDSHELLRCLLDAWCTEESSARRQMKSSQGEGKTPNTDSTFVDAIFGGQLSSTVSCLECGHSSTVYEPFLDLSLPVPTKKPPSKKAQPVSRAKKPKLPPRRSTRIRSRGGNNENVLPAQCTSDKSTIGEPSCQVQSKVPAVDEKSTSALDSVSAESKTTSLTTKKTSVSKNILADQNAEPVEGNEKASEKLAPVNDATWLGILSLDGLLEDKHSASEINSPVANASEKEDDVLGNISLQNTVELSTDVMPTGLNAESSSEDLTWMNFCGPGELLDGDDISSQVNLERVIGDPTTKDAAQGNIGFELYSAAGNCVSLSGSNVEDELPLQAQNSAIIMLPYRDEATSHETVGEGEASSSAVGCDNETSEFDGFGGLFDEPEADVASLKSSEANAVQAGAIVGQSSESDPDEVDNSDAPVSVESCLSYFIKPELLSKDEHAWQCENCSKVLLEQKMRLRKESLKPKLYTVIDKGEGNNARFHFSSDKKQPISNGTRNLCNGMIEEMISHTDCVSELSYNLEVTNENNGAIGTSLKDVASQLEDRKSEREDLACNSSESCSTDKPSQLESHFSENNEPESDRHDSDSVQLEGSESVAVNCHSEGEDEEMDSKNVKVKRDATKRILINRAPPILTIHLKRFTQDARGRLSKLNGHVDFRETINLKNYIDPRLKVGDQFQYRLLGVVEHLGTMRGGHYVAYIRGGMKSPHGPGARCGDFKWYHASDAYIREATLEEVLRCEAYMLFYEQI